MKAIVCKEFGPPSSLVYEDVEVPELKKSQIGVSQIFGLSRICRPLDHRRQEDLTEKTYPDHRRPLPPPTTCFDALPSSTLPTRLAKFSVQKVSSTLY